LGCSDPIEYSARCITIKEEIESREREEFGTLLRFTAAGFTGGLLWGAFLDALGFQRSTIGQWLIRPLSLSREGESLFEGIYTLRQRFRGAAPPMVEAYGKIRKKSL